MGMKDWHSLLDNSISIWVVKEACKIENLAIFKNIGIITFSRVWQDYGLPKKKLPVEQYQASSKVLHGR